MTNFFSTKLLFLNVSYFKNHKIKVDEVVLQLRFARKILALFSWWLVLEKSQFCFGPIKFLKYWSCSTFFFRNLFFLAILRWTFFLLKFWSFYQLLNLDKFSYSPISIQTMIFGSVNKVSEQNLKIGSWITSFSPNFCFWNMNDLNNCQIRIQEVVLQLHFFRQILIWTQKS